MSYDSRIIRDYLKSRHTKIVFQKEDRTKQEDVLE